MQTTIKIQARGVVTLPKKIREKAGLNAGSIVDIEARNGKVTMRAVPRLDPSLVQAARDALNDLKTGRASPVFSSIKELSEYMKNKRRQKRGGQK